ncbi:sensor histidine kinase [Streptomyces roseifaciens]
MGWQPVDTFERFYFAMRAPLCGSRWSGIDVLVVSALVAQTLHIAFQPVPGLLPGALPSAAVGMLVAGTFLWRREAPFLAAAASFAGLTLNGSRVPVFFALYALAKYGGRYRFGAIFLCAFTYIPLTIILPGAISLVSFIGIRRGNEDILSTSVLMTIPVLSGLGAAAYEKTIHALHVRERLLEKERERRIGEEKMAERLTLAREMHDVLGHRIAIMAMHAGALEMVVKTGRPQGEELARSIGDTARAAMRDLREVLSALRDTSVGAPVGTKLSDLDELISASRECGLHISFAMTSEEAREETKPEVFLAVYRTIQESLTNALKYAPGARVSVTLSIGRPVTVCVTNTGTGHEAPLLEKIPVSSGGFGLVGLRERVSALGGTFSAGATDDGGWRVKAVIPNPDC